MKKILLGLMAVMLCAVSAGAGENPAPVPAEVTEDKAFVRADHDNKSKRVATLGEGDYLDLLEEWRGAEDFPWYRVQTDDGEGWIYGQVIRRLDGAPVAAAVPAAGQRDSLPAAGIISADKDYVTVIAHGQGTDRTKARDQAWIEAVRLAVGAVISSTSELNNDDFAENTIAHSRGVVETFDPIGEIDDGKRVTVAIRAKVRKETLTDAARIYSEAQTVKADAGGAVKVQMDAKAQDRTTEDKQTSGLALLKEVLNAYGPEAFYSAELNPKVELSEEGKRPFIKVTQEFNQDFFWKEFIPRLHEALEGVAFEKEEMYYSDEVRRANQKFTKEGYAEWLGTYGDSILRNPAKYSNRNEDRLLDKNNRQIEPNPIAPYSWHGKDDGDRGLYPFKRFLTDTKVTSGIKAPLTVVIPKNVASFVVYYLPCDISFNPYNNPYETPAEASDKELYSLFINYRNRMTAPLVFSITYLDSNGDEIHIQIIRTGSRMLTMYRSFYFNEDESSIGKPVAYWPIQHIFSFSPGFVDGARQHLFLGSENYDAKYNTGWYIELDETDLQRLDSMKFEYIFENQ